MDTVFDREIEFGTLAPPLREPRNLCIRPVDLEQVCRTLHSSLYHHLRFALSLIYSSFLITLMTGAGLAKAYKLLSHATF